MTAQVSKPLNQEKPTTDEKFLYYKGRSMRGVFRTGDRLLVNPCSFDQVAAGDIIVFNQGKQDIVHRVTEKREHELVTAGDSNPGADPESVSPEQIIGKVVRIDRLGKTLTVRNGKKGFREWGRHHRFWMSLFTINGLINRFLGPGSLSWLFSIHPKLLRMENPDICKITYRKRTIGRFNPGDFSFHLRKPWSFFVSRRFINECLKKRTRIEPSR